LRGLWQYAQHGGWFLPHTHTCWCAERHTTLVRNAEGRLHCHDGLACGYPDGWGAYALNGVRMEEWMVMTPADRLDPTKILAVSNVEQRRELIRKVGMERFLTACRATVVNTQGEYALLSVTLSDDIRDARFLKMKNPSIGVWHVEGVHPSCQTVQEAINWRASGDPQMSWHPTILT
jgi:hypothetical protein